MLKIEFHVNFISIKNSVADDIINSYCFILDRVIKSGYLKLNILKVKRIQIFFVISKTAFLVNIAFSINQCELC